MAGPDGWPPRLQVPPGPQAREQLLKLPYAADQAREGELLKGDLTPLSGIGVIEKLCAEAIKDVAVATAAELHKGNPVAASMAVATALQNVLATQMMGEKQPQGTPERLAVLPIQKAR